MSRKFLTNIDLNQNELQNTVIHNLATDPSGKAGQIYFNTVDQALKFYDGSASAWVSLSNVDTEQIEDAVAQLLAAGTGISLDYNDGAGSLTIANTGVTSVLGTANEVEVSASAGAVTIGLPSSITVDVTGDLTGNADTATELATARTISLGGSLSGSVSFDGSQDVTITADIVADAVTLGTDTTGNYVASVSGSGDGISVTGSGEGAAVTISNTGVTSIASQDATEIYVSGSAGAITIGLPDDVTIDGDLVVGGNLTVSGSTTYLNTATLTVEDNIVLLNSNVTGTPTADAGIEVERGDYTNTSLYWDESANKWVVDVVGDNTDPGTATGLSLEGHTHSTGDVTGLQEYVEDTVGTMLTDSSTVDFTYSDNAGSAGTFTASVITASTSYLTTASGLAVDISSVETQLVTDGFTKKAAANVGNGSNTSFAVNHNLGTRDVVVNVYDSATYDTVEVDVVRTNTNTVTVTFASAPSSNAYRVVVIG